MDSSTGERAMTEQVMRKRMAELEEGYTRLAIKRAKMREWQQVREERVRQGIIQKEAHERILVLDKRDKEFEIEFSSNNSSAQTDRASIAKVSIESEVNGRPKTGVESHPSLMQENIRDDLSDTTHDDPSGDYSPMQSLKSPLHRRRQFDAEGGEPQTDVISRSLPGNLELFQGNQDPTMSDLWAVCCARRECRTNTTKHREMLKGAKGVCIHARASHYQAWKPIFERKADQTKLFGDNPDWCEWYQFTKDEYDDWCLSGILPETAIPRGVATYFVPSQPPKPMPKQKFWDF